jgi:Na+-translocating ferredoxin:NAD+ oxidoreductase subunit B
VSADRSTDLLCARLDAALPQTQCTRCGYTDCRAYAHAIAHEQAPINQCPPGGAEGVARLAAISGRDVVALNPAHGVEGPRQVMFIDEDWCIGCTLCIKACPVHCIVGAPKSMHTIVESLCTGCALCLPACPVDCIGVEVATPGRSGWDAWSDDDAERARRRYAARQVRLQREQADNDARLAAQAAHKLADLAAASRITDADALERKRAAIEAAMARSRERRATPTQ